MILICSNTVSSNALICNFDELDSDKTKFIKLEKMILSNKILCFCNDRIIYHRRFAATE